MTDSAALLELELERARRKELEREVATLRRSEAFRIGHALVSTLRALRWRGRAVRSAGPSRALTSGTAAGGRGKAKRAGRRRTGRVLLISLDGDLDGLPAELDSLERMLESFEPVLMADAGAVGDRLGGSSLTVEHLMPLRLWQLHRPAIDWGPYVAKRVASTLAEYDPDAVVLLSTSDSDRAADLSAILAPIILPNMARSETNLV